MDSSDPAITRTSVPDHPSTDVCGDPAKIDERWITDALEQAGIACGAKVIAVAFDGFIGTGQTGRNARLQLLWDDPEGRPASLVGKFPSGDEGARASAFQSGTYLTEYEFYKNLAHTLQIRTPACHVARFDHERSDFVLLMEDLSGSRQGDQLAGLTVDEAALGVEQAVGLHAPRWGDPTLRAFAKHRPKGVDAAVKLGTNYQKMVGIFLERLGPGLDADVIDLFRAFSPKAVEWAGKSDTPRTAVHLDFRPDNFMFGVSSDAPPLVVVDWQTVTDGHAMMDLAYMIGGSFHPERRAAVERDLLSEYRQRLLVAGVDYGADTQWRDYRLSTMWGLFITVIATVLAAETERGNRMFTVMAQRHARHAIDLDAMDLFS